MKPGPDLDALIAEKVMGWKASVNPHPEMRSVSLGDLYKNASIPMPKYSTDMAAAWMVLEEMHARGISWCIEQADNVPFATVHIINPTTEEKCAGHLHFIDDMEKISESAESVAHAICLAALKAIENKLI